LPREEEAVPGQVVLLDAVEEEEDAVVGVRPEYALIERRVGPAVAARDVEARQVVEDLLEIVIAAPLELFAGDHGHGGGGLAQALPGLRNRRHLGRLLLPPHLRDERREARRRTGLEGCIEAQNRGDLPARFRGIVDREGGQREQGMRLDRRRPRDLGAEARRELGGDVFEKPEVVALPGLLERVLTARLSPGRPGRLQDHQNSQDGGGQHPGRCHDSPPQRAAGHGNLALIALSIKT
jgi:hypothetical protein